MNLLGSILVTTALGGAAQDGAPAAVIGLDEVVEGAIGDDAAPVETETLTSDRQYRRKRAVGLSYSLVVEESGPATFELRSYVFDPYLVLRGPDGEVLAEDDDSLIGPHARIVYDRLEAGQAYELVVCALREKRGPFELTTRRGHPEPLTQAGQVAFEIDDHRRRVKSLEQVFGARSREVGAALNALGVTAWRRGAYDEARDAWERALEVHEEVLGPADAMTGTSLNNLAMVHRALGELDRSRELAERALAVWEEVYGPDHTEVATALGNLAGVLKAQGDLAAARPLYDRALAIVEAARGPGHPSTAIVLDNLAELLREQGEYAEARLLLDRSLAIHEEASGPDSPATAVSLNNLALLLQTQGDYAAARPLYERALAIHEASFGASHPYTALSLDNLGAVAVQLGDLERAQALYERSVGIYTQTLGATHPSAATALNNLASVLEERGELAAARPMYERALASWESTLGPEHPRIASLLGNLAGLLKSLGDRPAAQPLLERALAIRERTLGPDHPDTAQALNNLALFLSEAGQPEKARQLLLRAQSIHEQVFGPDHPAVAAVLANLGVTYRDSGDDAAARPLFERALAIVEDRLGSEHPQTATAIKPLALILVRAGELAAARELMERALGILERNLGLAHPATAACVSNLALVLADQGELQAAWDLVRRDRTERDRGLAAVLAGLSEAERYPYLAQRFWQLEIELSLARRMTAPAARREAYESVLAWKGRVRREALVGRARLWASLGPEQRTLVEAMRACQTELARLVAATDPEQREARDARLGALQDERRRLERSLQETLPAGEATELPDFDELRASLEPGSALVDFLVHRIYEPGEGVPGSIGEDRVSAWIVRPERDQPVEIDLGPAAAIERAAARHLGRLLPDSEAIALRGVRVASGPAGSGSEELRRLLWDPLAPHVEDAGRLFLSTDAFLATIPFEILELEDGSYLLEHHPIAYPEDATSLARAEASSREPGSVLAVGDVDFDAPLGSGDPGDATHEGAWPRLPATGPEARIVVELHERKFEDDLPRLLLQGGECTEERLVRELPRHAVLHLATHGYYQAEGAGSRWASAREQLASWAESRGSQTMRAIGAHPGLLSGLVCAGANRAPATGAHDGRLTAEEVDWLDLSSVELVVLSACETGLGLALSGEGLLGLRRAFHTAGARTVISSLWSVQDESTAELMRDFYTNLWLKDMGRHEALRQAQLAMLARNRAEHGDALPATWGAFVLSGEWR